MTDWVAHKQELFTLAEVSVAAPIALIALGILGITASVWSAKK